MKSNKSKQKIYVAMSGGVDSSVAAALLKKQGYEVTGVFLKPWSDSADTEYCNWREDRQDAMRVAAKLGIKFKTWDFSKEYGRLVTKYMVDSYRSGITPNPDVMCNKEIKFGLFLKKALSEDADMIATGHYVRIKTKKTDGRHFYKLLRGKDQNKDQSYFLYNLTQKELKHCIFPIGGYTKPEVRKLAKKFKLSNHAKRDSQGVCFIGQLDMKAFLVKYIKPKSGEVRLILPRFHLKPFSRLNLKKMPVIGTHDGVYYYTIGQRHGLNLSIAGGPYFIVSKDLRKNIIYVSNQLLRSTLNRGELEVKNVSWVDDSSFRRPSKMRVDVKIRYRSTFVSGVITLETKKKLKVKFSKPVRAVTSGQSAVFYHGQEVLGGGVII